MFHFREHKTFVLRLLIPLDLDLHYSTSDALLRYLKLPDAWAGNFREQSRLISTRTESNKTGLA